MAAQLRKVKLELNREDALTIVKQLRQNSEHTELAIEIANRIELVTQSRRPPVISF